jgi:DNA repair exonuclease SbcCD ATPase subunit
MLELKRCSFKAKENGLCMRHQLNKKEYENDGICQANLHYSKPPAEHKKRGRPPKTPVDAPQDSFEKENLRQRRNARQKELRERNSELRTRLWKKNGLPAPPLESPPTESEKYDALRAEIIKRQDELDALSAEIIKRHDELNKMRSNFVTSFNIGWSGMGRPENVPWSDKRTRHL